MVEIATERITFFECVISAILIFFVTFGVSAFGARLNPLNLVHIQRRFHPNTPMLDIIINLR